MLPSYFKIQNCLFPVENIDALIYSFLVISQYCLFHKIVNFVM
jgi:hypothetical protein